MTAVVDLTGLFLLTLVLIVAITSFVSGVAWAIAVEKHDDPVPDHRRRQLERLAIEKDVAEVTILRPGPYDFDEDTPA